MQAYVKKDGEYSEPFPVTTVVKQGCVIAPTLFSKMFSTMLTDPFEDCVADFFPISDRFDGKLFNLRWLQTNMLHKLFYADDLAENAKSEGK